jgi:hypothetical protein
MVDVSFGSPVNDLVARQRAQVQLSRSVSETATDRARVVRQEIVQSGQQRGFQPAVGSQENIASPTPTFGQEREFRISDGQVNDRFFDRIDDARSDAATRTNAENSINSAIESDRLSTAAFQATESSRQLIEAADQRRQDTRAAELSAQVQQQLDLQLADERLVNAQNDPSQPRGSLVDLFA